MKPKMSTTLLARWLAVAVGGLVSAVGINLLLAPQSLVPAGVSGISVLLSYATGWPAGLLYAALNVPLFALAWRQIDRAFALSSVVGLVAFAGGLVATAPLADLNAVKDPLLSAIFGGAIAGAGAGLSLRYHGSLGGMDIVGVLVRKKLSTSIAGTSLVTNAGVVGVLAAMRGLEPALMTMLSLTAGAVLFDRVLTGLNRSKAILVVTDHPQAVAEAILTRLRRGVTFLDGEGAFRKTKKRLVYCVATQRQLASVKRLIADIDRAAFVAVFDATEVIGEGFVPGPGE